MSKKYTLYKIYYRNNDQDICVYLGRTKQPLQTRLRGHFFKLPMHREIDIHLVSKIEYAEFPTVADMYLYEIYFINLLKPVLNKDDKANDELTISLPEVKWTEYKPPLMDKWKQDIQIKDEMYKKKQQIETDFWQKKRALRQQRKDKIITEEEYDNLLEKIEYEHYKTLDKIF